MSKPVFKFITGIGETDSSDAIWALKFHPNPTAGGLFAYVVRQGVRACRLTDSGFELLHSYDIASDPQCQESLYACSWAQDATSLYIAVGGKTGIIRIVDCKKNAVVRLLIGHTRSVFDMSTHPRELHLLLSGSTDMCARIWDVSTGACLAVLGGMQGHRSGLLSVSWRHDSARVATGSFDRSVRVWDIPADMQQRAAKAKRPLLLHYPSFTTSWHRFCVDCVLWVGNMVVSKSVKGRISVWKPPPTQPSDSELEYFLGIAPDPPADDDSTTPTAAAATATTATTTTSAADAIPGVSEACAVYDAERDSAGVPRLDAFPPLEVLREFNYADSNAWWPKFDVNAAAQLLAVGAPGVVYVYDFVTGKQLATLDVGIVHESSAPVLAVAFAPGRRTLLAATGDGRVCRFDYAGNSEE